MTIRRVGAVAILLGVIMGLLPLVTEAQVATSPMWNLLLSQGSSTSGQSGPLVFGAVTVSAPTYTTGQTNPLSLTTTGALRVDGSAVTQPVSGTVTASGPLTDAQLRATAVAVSGPLTDTELRATAVPISGTVTANAGTGTLATNVTQVGGTAISTGTGVGGLGIPRVTVSSDSTVILGTGSATVGALTANQSVNVAQVNGVATTTGNGISGTGVQRVTIASDSTGQVTANAGTNLNTSALLTESTFTTRVNTQGQKTMAASTPVVLASDQLICTSKAAFSQTASAQLVAGVASQRIYLCAVILITAADQSISLVEGTGSVCATGIAAVMGGTTASMALVANGGLSSVAAFPWISTATNANALCLLQSGSGNVSGVITYRQG